MYTDCNHTERDVIDTVNNTMGHHTTHRNMPNAYQILERGVTGSTKKEILANFQDAHKKYRAFLPPIITKETTARPKTPVFTNYSAMFDARHRPTTIERQKLDKPPLQLKRRPTGPDQFRGIPIVYTGAKTHIPRSQKQKHPDPAEFDDWRKFSLTTLVKADDPLDPDSYYNTHYPLMLQRVPRRTADDDSAYRPISKTPDMEEDWFASLPHGPLVTSVEYLDEDIQAEEDRMKALRTEYLVTKLKKYGVTDTKKQVFRDQPRKPTYKIKKYKQNNTSYTRLRKYNESDTE